MNTALWRQMDQVTDLIDIENRLQELEDLMSHFGQQLELLNEAVQAIFNFLESQNNKKSS